MSVNYDGDSDSTGALCGNLLGALYGINALPREWIKKVEMKDFIMIMADHLFARFAGN